MHLTEEEIEKLLANGLQPTDQRRIIRHLLAGCGFCSRRIVEQAPGLLLEKTAEDRHRKVVPGSPQKHALAAAVDQEARWRPDEGKLARSLERLGRVPQNFDGFTLRQVQNLHGPPLVEALLRRAWDLRYHDPRTAQWLTYNAVKIAGSLDLEEHGSSLVLDLQARTWGELANTYRLNVELPEAEAALARACTLVRQGSGDLRTLARLVELEGSLRNTQGRRTEARELFNRTHRLYLTLGDRHLAGQALIAKGNTGEDEGGSFQLQAVRLVQRGLSLLDPARDPTAVLAGKQTLIAVLGSYGDFRAAGELILKSGLRRSLGDNPFLLLKLRWAEAMVYKGFGRMSRAERALVGVREGFVELERTIESSLVGLHLLPVWVQLGKSREVEITAREIYGIFRDLRLQRAAAKTRRYLQ